MLGKLVADQAETVLHLKSAESYRLTRRLYPSHSTGIHHSREDFSMSKDYQNASDHKLARTSRGKPLISYSLTGVRAWLK